MCKDTGPLTKARMVTIDDDITNRAVDFIQAAEGHRASRSFVWVNYDPYAFSALTPSRKVFGQSGRWQSPYHDTMIDHDKNVGTILKALDDLGIAVTPSSCTRPTTART